MDGREPLSQSTTETLSPPDRTPSSPTGTTPPGTLVVVYFCSPTPVRCPPWELQGRVLSRRRIGLSFQTPHPSPCPTRESPTTTVDDATPDLHPHPFPLHVGGRRPGSRFQSSSLRPGATLFSPYTLRFTRPVVTHTELYVTHPLS